MERKSESERDPRTVATRAPYEPPAIEGSAEFETLAGGCSKVPGNAICEDTGVVSAS